MIGTETSNSALVYGLMSLTDKLGNGLAVVVIQQQVPCLRLYQNPADPSTTTEPPCTASPGAGVTGGPCTQSPGPVPRPDPASSCLTFYRTVLVWSMAGAATIGAVFVIVLLAIRENSNIE